MNTVGQTVSAMQSVEVNNNNDITNEESDDGPCFIIKPFEKSIEQVEADGQTAIKVFNLGEGPGANGFDLDDEDEFDFGDESDDKRIMISEPQ